MSLSQSYQILDVSLRLESDEAQLIDCFNEEYGAFRIQEGRGDGELRVRARLADSPACLWIDEIPFSLVGFPEPARHCRFLILREVFHRMERFLLLHASVAVDRNRALIITGAPGVGKTTLLMRLLEGGRFAFFSEDICPIERASGLVFHFPRSAWLKNRAKEGAKGRLSEKRRAPVDLTRWVRGSNPTRPACVIALERQLDDTPDQHLLVHMKNPPNAQFLAGLSLPGVHIEVVDGSLPGVKVRYSPHSKRSLQLRQLFDEWSDQIWSVHRFHDRAPQFRAQPQVCCLKPSELATRLVGDLKQDFLVTETGLSRGRLLFEVSGLLARVDAYEIRTGPLEELVGVVERLWEKAVEQN